MDCRLEGLVMKASILPNVDFKMITQKITEDIDRGMCKSEIYKDLYKKIYDYHLQPDECEELVECLHQGERQGKVWTLEETNSVAKKLDYDFSKYTEYEFWTVMHLMYYKINFPLKESGNTIDSANYGRLANFYFIRDMHRKDNLIDCFFKKCCNIN